MTSTIEIDEVSKLYSTSVGGAAWALQGASFSLSRGQFVCAIGPSGCGKTTLLNLMAGYFQPTQGSVRINGNTITAPGPDRGVVFQDYALYPWLTARRNVEFGLKVRGVPAQERTRLALEYLELVGLARAADSYPHELSGGMRQRVAVARALVNKPNFLLMDEPFAAVDSLTRASLQQELVRMWQELGIGVFMITHNIEEAVFLAERVIVMTPHPGRIQETIDLDLPYPRNRASTEFGQMYAKVSDAFHQMGDLEVEMEHG
jgi:NitT/TauT family transport system ATP-binding protein